MPFTSSGLWPVNSRHMGMSSITSPWILVRPDDLRGGKGQRAVAFFAERQGLFSQLPFRDVTADNGRSHYIASVVPSGEIVSDTAMRRPSFRTRSV